MADTAIAPPAGPPPEPTVARSRARIILHVVVVLGAIAMFFPFFWTIITSISPGRGPDRRRPSLIPENPSLEAYARLFTELPFGRVIVNSLAARRRSRRSCS